MLIRKIPLPVTKEQKEFCDYMGYSFLYMQGDRYVYDVPGNHVCRFILNFDSWKKGQFNREKFLSQPEH